MSFQSYLHNEKPPFWVSWLLPLVLFLAYGVASYWYEMVYPAGKLLPTYGEIWRAWAHLAFEPSRRSGSYIFWIDMATSLARLSVAVVSAAVTAFVCGIVLAFYPAVRSVSLRTIVFISNMPIISLTPVLMIVFGVGEVFKVLLVYLGVVFVATRDMYRAAQTIPRQHIVKGLLYGGNTWRIMRYVVVPQLLPRLYAVVRLVLPAAWIYLISAEMIASTAGLGYRIALVRRYMAMDVILAYIVVIAILAFVMDKLLFYLIKRHTWLQEGGK